MTFWNSLQLTGFILALLIGVSGAILFSLFTLPLAFMLGSMCATGLAALSGVKMAFPRVTFKVVGALVGIFLGASVTPEMLVPGPGWIISLVVLFVFTLASAAISFLILFRLGNLNVTTALFAGAPGGVTEFAALADAAGGDSQTVAFLQSARIFLIVLTIPLLVSWISDGAQTTREIVTLAQFNLSEVPVLMILAAMGTFVGHLLRVPAKVFLGPFFLTVLCQKLGVLSEFSPSRFWLQISQIILGIAIGVGFVGSTWKSAAKLIKVALVSAGCLIVVTICTTAFLSMHLPIEFLDLTLAFAPAGMMEMSVVATNLGAAVPYILAHHLFRIVEVSLIIPLVWRVKIRR